MNLNGVILECLSLVKGNNSDAVVFNENKYYSINRQEIRNIYNNQVNAYSSMQLLGGMWVSEKNSGTTKYVDLFNAGNSYTPISYVITSIDVCNNVIIASTSGIRKRKLLSIDLSNGRAIEKEFNKGLVFTLDHDCIFTRSEYEKLVECYSYQFDKIWEYTDLEGDIYLDFERKPQIYNDLLIINHAYDTIALNKKTGKEVWKYTFEDIPTSNILMAGKVYAVCNAQLYIIGPDNGDVLLKVDTNYPTHFPDNGELSRQINDIGIFPIGDYLYGIARYEENGKLIRLYNKDCSEMLHQVSLENYYLNPYTSIMPTIRDGKIYQPVRNLHSFSDSGILVMDISGDDTPAGVKVAPRPPVTMLATPSLNVPHKQQVFLDVNNLDDTLRYGDLLTKELQFATGYIAAYHERENALDTKHNGELELIIDDTGFEEGSEDYLNSLSARLKEFLEGDTCKAGDKKTTINFTLLKQKKCDWNLTGEPLDWPAIRDMKAPIS